MATAALTSSVPSSRREQRLRLRDLGHFRRRRKAFERGREDVVGVERGGRSIDKSLASASAARNSKLRAPCCLRDGDGGQERFLGGRGVGGVALQQDFAARPMQFGFECAIAGAIGRRQRFVEDCYGAAGIARLGLRLSASAIFNEPVKNQDVLRA